MPNDLDNRIDPNVSLGRIRSAALFDLATGIDWRNFSVELYAQNIFDKRNDLSRCVTCASCTRVLVVPGHSAHHRAARRLQVLVSYPSGSGQRGTCCIRFIGEGVYLPDLTSGD